MILTAAKPWKHAPHAAPQGATHGDAHRGAWKDKKAGRQALIGFLGALASLFFLVFFLGTLAVLHLMHLSLR